MLSESRPLSLLHTQLNEADTPLKVSCSQEYGAPS